MRIEVFFGSFQLHVGNCSRSASDRGLTNNRLERLQAFQMPPAARLEITISISLVNI